VSNLDPFERGARTGLAKNLAKTRLFPDQYHVEAARRDGGKDTINLDARCSIGAHRVDCDPDLAQALSSSLFSTTMRSL
jgi:hypothetical protein